MLLSAFGHAEAGAVNTVSNVLLKNAVEWHVITWCDHVLVALAIRGAPARAIILETEGSIECSLCGCLGPALGSLNVASWIDRDQAISDSSLDRRMENQMVVGKCLFRTPHVA
jgi:hypothetical protein